MEINYKKALKFMTLLISALLIGTASAAVYNYMQITATVGVTNFVVNFYEGEDTASAGGSISTDRQTADFNSLNGVPGYVANYTDIIRICNNDTSNHYISLEIASYSYNGNATTTLDYVKFKIYDSSGSLLDTLQLDPHGDDGGNDVSTGSYNLNGNDDWWRVQCEVFWFSNATNSDSVSITLKVTVQI